MHTSTTVSTDFLAQAAFGQTLVVFAQTAGARTSRQGVGAGVGERGWSGTNSKICTRTTPAHVGEGNTHGTVGRGNEGEKSTTPASFLP